MSSTPRSEGPGRLTIGLALILASLVGCGRSGEDELVLLPDGFMGPVLVVFDQQDGQPIEYRGDARVYRVPTTGILKTQFLAQYGYIATRYFYARRDTLVRKIPHLFHFEIEMADTGLYVFHIEPGSTSRLETAGSITRTRGDLLHFRTFVVGYVAAGDSLYEQAERLAWRLTERP